MYRTLLNTNYKLQYLTLISLHTTMELHFSTVKFYHSLSKYMYYGTTIHTSISSIEKPVNYFNYNATPYSLACAPLRDRQTLFLIRDDYC